MVMDALKPLNVPVAFQKYSGKAECCITFHEYMASGEKYEEDEETLTGHYIQVDIWSKSDYTELVGKTRDTLTRAGFKRLNEIDLYEDDTKIYHKGMKFFYLEEREVY
jgi:hypothetical protein